MSSESFGVIPYFSFCDRITQNFYEKNDNTAQFFNPSGILMCLSYPLNDPVGQVAGVMYSNHLGQIKREWRTLGEIIITQITEDEWHNIHRMINSKTKIEMVNKVFQ